MSEIRIRTLSSRVVALGSALLAAAAAGMAQAPRPALAGAAAPPTSPATAAAAPTSPAPETRQTTAPHLAERFGIAPLAELGPAAVEAPDRLEQLAAWNAAGRLPAQNGFARPLPAPRPVGLALPPAAPGAPAAASERDGGVLAATSFTTAAWGGSVRVAGAFRLRLHLSHVVLPAGARLWVHGAGQTMGPFGAELVAPDRSLWTPAVAGDEIALDVEAPTASLAGASGYGFTIDAALELVPPSLSGSGTKDGGCVVDASCVGSDDFPGYDTARHAVALLEFVDQFVGFACTGQLLADAANDGTPFLLTAHHCLSTQAVAATLQATFDDFTPSCNGTPPDLGSLPAANGATLLVTGRADTAPDFTLLRLDSLPAGRTFLPWDPSPQATPNGTQLFRLSHPEGNAQAYSVTRVDSRAAQCTLDNLPLSRFLYSDLAVGAVEPGSSGSAAMLADGRVVGQLFGSCGIGDVCARSQQTVDGALAASFAQLQPFLAPGATGVCTPGDFTLCLTDRRFAVQVTWANQFDGSAGVAHAIAGTDAAGYFYFTDPANYELTVKILDFGDVFKVFYGELTDLHFTITVVDTHTGQKRTYTNTAGDCGGIDEAAFPATAAEPADAIDPAGLAAPAELAGAAARRGCGGALCLDAGRFAVDVTWMNQFNGTSGAGVAHPLSDTSGQFTFTDPSDLELLVKVVELPGRVAFFYAALSNLEYDITVADTITGKIKTYHNPAGTYCGGFDNDAFPPSP